MSPAVSFGWKRGDWGRNDSWASAARGDAVRSEVPMTTRPVSGEDSPHTCLSVVVLPQPFAPTSSVICPGAADKSSPSSTRRQPYVFVRLVMVIIGVALVSKARGRPRQQVLAAQAWRERTAAA